MNELKGIIPPLATPLLNEKELDVEGLRRLIEHVLAGGVHGLFILGTTGEGPSLAYDLRLELIERVCDQVDGRVPVLVSIADTSFRQATYVADKSREAGAQAVVLAPPFFYEISQGELIGYVERLLREVSLPTVLYNNPALTNVNYGLDAVRTLASRSEVVGFKDSSGDAVYFQKLHPILSESGVPLFVGPEELLMETLVMGGDGGVPGGANIFPELYVDLYEATRAEHLSAEHLSKARKLHDRIVHLSSVVYEGSTYGSSRIISGIKSALSHRGLCSDWVAPPLCKSSPEKDRKIAAFVRERSR